ncbi:MAG: right-handed parallel beta-helix repeat-containing protein [Spirochaetes bacterium]|nr:right-handed parallel beta-helix repeat-containing protein [Spirochaetota bacterium]
MDEWKRTISAALGIATNNCILECYGRPGGFREEVRVSGFTNLIIRSAGWVTNSDNTNTVINGTSYNRSIIITNSRSITVQGFTITNAQQDGVYIINAVSNRIVNNRIVNHATSGTYSGIRIRGDFSDYNTVTSNEIYNDGGVLLDYGIWISDADHNTISSNKIHNLEDYGIYFQGSAQSNRIIQNEIFSNASRGITVDSETADYNIISSNIFYDNLSIGIYINFADYFTIDYNNIFDLRNQNYGLYITDGDHHVIYSNRIHTHNYDGIYMNGASADNYISQNMIYSNGLPNNRYGIWLDSNTADNNMIYTNQFFNNYRGIYLDQPDYIKISRNLFHNNLDIGVYVYDNANYCDFINNTFYNNSRGIYINTSTVRITNNIFLSHVNHGIIAVSGSSFYDYNVFWDNGTDVGNPGNFTAGASNRYASPLINTSSTFEIISSFSICVDKAKIVQGLSDIYNETGPDIGWKESLFNPTNRPFTVHILPPMDIWTNAITNALSVATNNCIIECHPESGAFFETVRISGFTNLTLRSFEWTNAQDNTTTVIDGISYNRAVTITNSKNIMILGFSIVNATNGIYIDDAVSNRIFHNRIRDNEDVGVYIYSPDANYNVIATNEIFNSTVNVQDYGIRITDGDYNLIMSNRIYNHDDYGIYIYSAAAYGPDHNVVMDNKIYNYLVSYQDYGCRIHNGFRNTVFSNFIYNNQLYGIYVTGTSRTNDIINNNSFSNSIGIYFIDDPVRYNNILTNRIFGNSSYGVLIDNGEYNRIERNVIYQNGSYGIYNYNGAHYNHIINNTLYKNTTYGIRGYTSTFSIYNNVILSNDSYGIVWSTSGTVTAGYNCIYGHSTAPWNPGVTLTDGNILLLNPRIDTVSSFTIISPSSPAVDSGTNYYSELFNGNEIDMGWKESSFTAVITNYVHILSPMDRWTNTINNALSIATNNCIIECHPNPLGFAESVLISGMTNIILRAYDWVNGNDNTTTAINGGGATSVLIITNSKNITVQGFSIGYANFFGAYITDAVSNRIINNRIMNNGLSGDGSGIRIVSDTGNANVIASNEIFNLMGAVQDFGIWVTDADNNSFISNQIHHHEDYGVYFTGSASSNEVINNLITSNVSYGIWIYSDTADHNLIRNNEIYGPGQNYGIYIRDGDHNIAYSNMILDHNYSGIYFYGTAQSNVIANNEIISNGWPNTRHGIWFDSATAHYNSITNNRIFGNASIGIYIDEPQYNLIANNDVGGGGQDYGIYIPYGDYNVIRSNRIHHVDWDGIQLAYTAISNVMIKNVICSNGFPNNRHGIYLYDNGPNYNSMISNRIYANQGYGIAVYRGDNNRIIRNLIIKNNYGIVIWDNANSTEVVNNSMGLNNTDGLYGNASSINIYNNVFLSNGRNGIYRDTGGGTIIADYNGFFGNSTAPWTIGITALANNITGTNLLIDTVNEFIISSSNSPCIDTALIITNISDSFYGSGPDIGWRESHYSNSSAYWVHIIPMDIWTRTIDIALSIATNNCIIECHVKPLDYAESVIITGFTNLILRSFDWTNTQDNTTTILRGDFFNRSLVITNSKNVTVEGFTITNALQYGIYINDAVSNRIKNCRIIDNGETGIRIASDTADHNSIISNHIFNQGGLAQNYGIYITDGDHNLIFTNKIYNNNDYGIYFTGSVQSNEIISCDIYNTNAAPQDYGIYITPTVMDYTRIIKNSLLNNADRGIHVTSGYYTYIFKNDIRNVNTTWQDYGMVISGCRRSTILSNRTYNHFYEGIHLNGGSSTNYIIKNQIYSNSRYGIYFTDTGVDSNLVGTNDIYENTSTAIYVVNADHNIYENNRIYNIDPSWRQVYGIYLAGGSYNTLFSNELHRIQDYGIYLINTAISNNIIKNLVCSNRDSVGIYLNSENADYNTIISNVTFENVNSGGIYVSLGDYNNIIRNLSYRNNHGIVVYNGANNTKVINNTIFKNSAEGVYGYISNFDVYNNIILSNGNRGIYLNTGGNIVAGYNCVYGNGIEPWSAGVITVGNNTIDADPMIEIVSNFTIAAANSPCVDTALIITNISDVYDGGGPDRGWKESSFSNSSAYWVHVIPMDIWTRTIDLALSAATNNCIIECYPKPQGFGESVLISGFTNLVLRSFDWTNIHNNYSTMLVGESYNRAVVITNSERITIQGFTITNADNYGIYINNSVSNRIVNNRVVNNGNTGIWIDSDTADYNTITSNNIFDSTRTLQDYGIWITDGDLNTIYSNNISFNQDHGIAYSGSAMSNRIIHNIITSNVLYGVYINSETADYNLISSNIIFNNGSRGIYTINADYCTITFNNLYDTLNTWQDWGIYNTSGDYFLISSNRIHNHTTDGIYMDGTSMSNYIVNNDIYSNSRDGIYVNSGSADFVFISTNRFFDNGSVGIQVNGGDYFEIINNDIYDTTRTRQDYGIYITSGDGYYIYTNMIYMHTTEGIHMDGVSRSNFIIRNTIYSNVNHGIYLYSNDADYNSILTNTVFNHTSVGIYVREGDYNRVNRNLSYDNRYGLYNYNAAQFTELYNNTVFGNSDFGIYSYNSTVYIYNNIIVSNGQYGIYWATPGNMYVGYNNLYGNLTAPWTSGIIKTMGNFTNKDPLIRSEYPFEILSPSSLAVDLASNIPGVSDQYNGAGPDMGYLESFFTNVIFYEGPYYVDDDTGDDLNPGTFIRPFRTIQKAVDRVSSGIVVSFATTYIYPGNYSEEVTIVSNYNTGFMVFTRLSNVLPLMDGGFSNNRAILINDTGNIILNGLAVCYYTNGITIEGTSTDIFITRNNIYSNRLYGIYINSDNADNNTINSNQIWGGLQDYGIYMIYSDSNTISSNLIYGNEKSGIVLDNSATFNYMIRNRIYFNGSSGISIIHPYADNNFIGTNRIYGPNQINGIKIGSGDNNMIFSNHICYNSSNGIYSFDDANNNSVIKNSIFSNDHNGILMGSDLGDANYILTNKIWGKNQDNGINLQDSDSQIIKYNLLYNNEISGIYINGNASDHIIAHNSIYSNSTNGLFVDSDTADNSAIVSNQITGWGQNYGIQVQMGDNSKIAGNIISRNLVCGIYINDSSDTVLSNNKIFYNREGINQINSSLSVFLNSITNNTNGVRFISGTMQQFSRNNVFNNSGYNFITLQPYNIITNNWWGTTVASTIYSTISNNGGYSNFTPYRLFGLFDIDPGSDTVPPLNSTGIIFSVVGTNVDLRWNRSTAPDFSRYSLYRSPIPGTTNLSRANVFINIFNVNNTNIIDTPGPGTWYYTLTALDNYPVWTNECWYAPVITVPVGSGNTIIALVKSISNVFLGGTYTPAIPGSSVLYKVVYYNNGSADGNNIIIYDRISPYVIYDTNEMGTATGWTLEYSTNSVPDQSYSSTAYSNGYTTKNDIKWIRWKKSGVGTGEDGLSLLYKVIIK